MYYNIFTFSSKDAIIIKKETILLFFILSTEREQAMEFQNKVAIITGAASGMGKLTAENLIAQGARVTVADITPVEEN